MGLQPELATTEGEQLAVGPDPRTPGEVASTPEFHFADPFHYPYNKPESWRERPILFRPENIHLRRIAQDLLGPPPNCSPRWTEDALGWAVGLAAFFRNIAPGIASLLNPSLPMLATIVEACAHVRQVEGWLGQLSVWCGTKDSPRVEEARVILSRNMRRAAAELLALLVRVRDGHPYLPELPSPQFATIFTLQQWAARAASQGPDLESNDLAVGLFFALSRLYAPHTSDPSNWMQELEKDIDAALDREFDGEDEAEIRFDYIVLVYGQACRMHRLDSLRESDSDATFEERMRLVERAFRSKLSARSENFIESLAPREALKRTQSVPYSPVDGVLALIRNNAGAVADAGVDVGARLALARLQAVRESAPITQSSAGDWIGPLNKTQIAKRLDPENPRARLRGKLEERFKTWKKQSAGGHDWNIYGPSVQEPDRTRLRTRSRHE